MTEEPDNNSLTTIWYETPNNEEISKLRAEVEEWKERWAAERRDHETTIRHFDKLMNEVP